jgi:hypothetical protein
MGAEWGIYHTGISILVAAGSQLYSKPFQVEDLLAKEEVLLWVEELLESEPYPGVKQLTKSLKEATHMHMIVDKLNTVCFVTQCFKRGLHM